MSQAKETMAHPTTSSASESFTTRTGGAYIPPARLRLMQEEITDKASREYQRISWEALKKSINGLINKVNVSNLPIIVRELLKENLIRGQGLFCRSVMAAQAASPTFTHVYAALVAIINTKLPQIGELLLSRLVNQFRRSYKRNDKVLCLSTSKFIAHLVNQEVVHELIALEFLHVFLENHTDDSIELAIAFVKECGKMLSSSSPKAINGIFESFRTILQEAKVDKRVQYMIEVIFAIRRDGFKEHPIVIEELDLVEEQDKVTHYIELDSTLDTKDHLNVFKFDENFTENEQNYAQIKKEILDESSSEDEDGEEDGDDSEDGDEDEEGGSSEILDKTETNTIALRRTIYLTFQSSLDFEECAHKLLKLELKGDQLRELCYLVVDCCAQQRTYMKYYGLLAQRLCLISQDYVENFAEIFRECFEKIHRFLDTNKLRNVAKFFAHLLFTDSIPWTILTCIHLNEEETTSSSRVFIKILFQELAEYLGVANLYERVKDPTLSEAFSGIFPKDNAKNTRFAINFFTLIGLGPLTEDLRTHLTY